MDVMATIGRGHLWGPCLALCGLVGVAMASSLGTGPVLAADRARTVVDLAAMDTDGDGRIDAREWKRGMAPHWAARSHPPTPGQGAVASAQGVVVVGPDGQERRLVPKAQVGAGASSNGLAALAAQREARQRTSILEARARARASGVPIPDLPDFADLDADGDGAIGREEARAGALARGWPLP